MRILLAKLRRRQLGTIQTSIADSQLWLLEREVLYFGEFLDNKVKPAKATEQIDLIAPSSHLKSKALIHAPLKALHFLPLDFLYVIDPQIIQNLRVSIRSHSLSPVEEQ